MRPLIWIMSPLLIVCILLASRLVNWDDLKKEDPEALRYVTEGTALLQDANGDYQGAVDAFSHAIQQDSTYATALIRRGLAYYYRGEYDKAIADYNQTLKLKRYRGDAYRGLGDHQRAIEDYAASIKERWAAFVMWKRAEVYLEIGKTQRALADYTAVIQRKHEAAAYYHRGNAYARVHEDDLALDDFDEAIKISPKFAAVYLSRGEIYNRLNQLQRAESDYLKVIELSTSEIQLWGGNHPTLGPIYYRRATAYGRLGRLEEARADYEMAIALQPDAETGRKATIKLRVVAADN